MKLFKTVLVAVLLTVGFTSCENNDFEFRTIECECYYVQDNSQNVRLENFINIYDETQGLGEFSTYSIILENVCGEELEIHMGNVDDVWIEEMKQMNYDDPFLPISNSNCGTRGWYFEE